VRLLLDEQISGKVAERLRDRERDVIAATDDLGLRGLSDPDLFEAAQQQSRAVVTYNRVDFEPIVREYAQLGREHHGLVIVHPTRFPSRDFAQLTAAIDGLAAADLGPSFLVWLQASRVAS
jgi:hypothetical protein